ncbi:ABC transporter permease [Labrys wisconsinensis]|uniref:Ribose/xylose/arabinose/galactoside ABC-type transport system permease subunit n=1 Tax=Labrys wisconsinensis TaxID=425677 RepID=A0ABU0J514_9HYPH|nr:ABC transporter permease [Labrys wisconsinensis]MDQ0469357.1 ribose/xylose/arabinose/galactoside ABC-type transport system permease subunit [Labrys wisconsinensis]
MRRVLFSDYLVLCLTLLYVAAIWPFVPEILNPSNLTDIFLQVLPLFIAAIGLMLVLMVAQIDLSATSIMATASVVGASIMTSQDGYLAGSAWAPLAAVAAFLAVGLAIGALNGACTALFGMPSFLVTLTTMMFFSGAAIWYTAGHTSSGSSIGALPPAFLALGYGGVLGIPYAAIATAAIAVGVHLMLSRSLFGRWLFAVGLNPQAAAISGVPVRRVVIATFVLSGLLSAVAAIVYTGRLEAGTPILGQRILLDVIGAAVIGGVSLFGGSGKVSGVFFGVLFLSVVDNGLQLLGLSLSAVYAIKGGVILFAAVTDAVRHRVAARGG